ncbi:hypothetical protein MPSEU_000502300 [Mayamaea pseudoterrestris]|nr:hypothetical protein MPSEU_000502300 [Mayamaea pseudoterrestris]
MVSEQEAQALNQSVEDILDYGAASADELADEDHDGDGNANNEALSAANAAEQEDADEVPVDPEMDDAGEIAVAALTRRLRCMFHVVTWPVVPLGTIVVLALVWMLCAAFVKEIHNQCAQPLHWYAGASLLIFLYSPFHTTMRARLFNYQRDRDGPNRPPSARRCDQVYHTIALLYVYAGITMVQTCREESLPDGENNEAGTCANTCPALFRAMSVYVVSLEVFTFSLILPLLFLPCIYLWLLRQVTVDSETLAILQERLRDEELLFRNGGVTGSEVMAQLERVKLVEDPEHGRIVVVGANDKDLLDAKDSNGVRDCCICMSDFRIHDAQMDVETGVSSEEDAEDDEAEAIVRTPCGHIMHLQCMASWIDGRWQSSGPQAAVNEDGLTRRARRTTCPLCRSDLRS